MGMSSGRRQRPPQACGRRGQGLGRCGQTTKSGLGATDYRNRARVCGLVLGVVQGLPGHSVAVEDFLNRGD